MHVCCMRRYYYSAANRVPQWKRPTAPAPGLPPASAPWHGGPPPAAAPLAAAAAFIPSPSFQGARFGYAFTMGPQGLGYYAEARPAVPAAAPPTHRAAPPAGPAAPAEPAAGAAHGAAAGKPSAGGMGPPPLRTVPHVGVSGAAGGGAGAGPRKTRQQQIAEAQAARNAGRGRNAGCGRSGKQELDPMDPVGGLRLLLMLCRVANCRL